ncbi:mitochondrial glutamate carrier 1-like isoform X2 [Anneissia japonica]|uniref:mitochondrial glutamate carrier 1-like isoform X2 n=1 Tax=Anneissia japonica TaxID=1529436 RepID=UPI0014255D5E|nr:mitochondrial glutamate carrier 1-like isoform X2 [Anneissia japonica]
MGEIGVGAKCINGAVAGVVGVTCIFPIDLVKTRLQNQQSARGSRLYNSLIDCFIKTLRQEGFRGLYKGYGVNVALISPEKSIKLAGNDIFRALLSKNGEAIPMYKQILAGGGAGLCQVVITTPMEMLKIQLQDAGRSANLNSLRNMPQGPPGELSSKLSPLLTRAYSATAAGSRTPTALEISRELFRAKGIMGVYRGFGATLMRDIPFSMLYFPLFAYLNEKGVPYEGGRATFGHSFVSGCLAATCASLSVNPIDVIKTRLQLLKQAKGEQCYTGILDCAMKIYKNEGVSAFFKGASCRMLVIAPLFGIAQGVYYIGVGEFILGINSN